MVKFCQERLETARLAKYGWTKNKQTETAYIQPKVAKASIKVAKMAQKLPKMAKKQT